MQFRRPSLLEVWIQALCLLAVALFAWDYLNALGAAACSPQPTAGCYPWGGEGPVAGSWTYSSKEAYLRASAVRIALLAAAAFAPFLARRPSAGVVAMTALAAAGLVLDETLARAF